MVFWDPGDAIEARFTGTASVHCRDEVAREGWQQVSPLRRIASAIEYAPGAVLSEPSRFDTLPTTADDDVALSHFAVVLVRATALDWFWLGPGDMRRVTRTDFHEGPDDGHVVDRNASSTKPANFVVCLIKDRALGLSCRYSDF